MSGCHAAGSSRRTGERRDHTQKARTAPSHVGPRAVSPRVRAARDLLSQAPPASSRPGPGAGAPG